MMNHDYETSAQREGLAEKRHRPFLLLMLFFSLFLAYLILRPFLHTIIFAIVLASLFYPLQERLVRLTRGKRNTSALLTIFVIIFVIVIPLFFFLSTLITQGVDSVNKVNDWIHEGNLKKLADDPRIQVYMDWLRERFRFVDLQKLDIQTNLLKLSKNFGQFLLSRGANLLGDMAGIIARFFIMMFIIFFLVRDGEQMVAQIKYLAPLRKDQENKLINRIHAVARSALLGSFLTALCQGLAGGIGLWIVGIPGLFWGTMMGFTSLVPMVGTALIWIPASIYLMLLGKMKAAVFLLAWCIFLVGAIDNFLRPFVMKGKAEMSPFYIFLAIIGGVQYFGLAGILYGPLILAFAMVMLYIYGVEYQDLLNGVKEETTESSPTPSSGP